MQRHLRIALFSRKMDFLIYTKDMVIIRIYIISYFLRMILTLSQTQAINFQEIKTK